MVASSTPAPITPPPSTQPFTLSLPFTSPYKATSLFVLQGKASWGIWQPLPITLTGNEEQIRVNEGQQGTCEYIAGQVYADRSLWWVIANANHIDFPFEEILAGMLLIIPDPQVVRAALLAASSVAVGASVSSNNSPSGG
jgi:hypothetical protein